MKPFYIRKSAIRALERATDAESWEILGALGVAADPYPHQIANVRHILAAPEIRHLIADEVGLGKTVQAFMILNVLRRRDPSLRVAIVAPERICYQWQAELSARAHIRADIWNEEVQTNRLDGEGCVHVIRAEVIRAEPALPSPQTYDLLIVDEPHVLSLRQMSFLATWCRAGLEGSRFRHVLLLTATPRLGNREWARSLFNILEPDQSEAANLLGREPLEHMLDAASAANDCPNNPDDSKSPYRRILRQTRQRWPDIAPRRRLETCFAQPSESELARISLASAALAGKGAVSELRLDSAPWQPTRQLFWSRETVLEAFRHRTFAAMAEHVDHCRTVLGRSPGDALFEELCDVLLQIWRRQPDRRVIIVAADTAAVDMIGQRLSRLFPAFAENELIAKMRGRQNTDLVDVVGAVHGGARILIMEEWVEAGLNLHHFADDIVFYGLPWSVGRIDQLIGRLDRLRPGGLRKAVKGQPVAEITIWRLVLRGSPDERVLGALDRMQVFDTPLPFLDDELAGRIDTVIANAAADAPGFLEMADQLAKEIHSGEAELSALVDRHTGTETTKAPLSSLIRTAERRGEDLLRTLDAGGALRVGWPKTVSGERVVMISLPKVIGDCPFAIGSMTTRESEALRVTRHRLGTSPNKDVLLSGDGLGRRARFFSTGDELHDELVRQALALGIEQDTMPTPRPTAICFPSGHEANALIGTTIAISAFGLRPAINAPSIGSVISQFGDWKCEGRSGFRLLHEGLVVGLDADQRWVAMQFPSVFGLVGTQIWDSGEREDVSPDICQSILSVDAKLRENSMGIPLCHDAAAVFRDHMMTVRTKLGPRAADMEKAAKEDLASRITQLMQDAEGYIRTRILNIKRLEGHNVTDVRQRQMQDGQIATERQRIEARHQSAMIRARTLEKTVNGLARSSKISVLRLLVRVIPAAGVSL